jgi:hypothetical protein
MTDGAARTLLEPCCTEAWRGASVPASDADRERPRRRLWTSGQVGMEPSAAAAANVVCGAPRTVARRDAPADGSWPACTGASGSPPPSNHRNRADARARAARAAAGLTCSTSSSASPTGARNAYHFFFCYWVRHRLKTSSARVRSDGRADDADTRRRSWASPTGVKAVAPLLNVTTPAQRGQRLRDHGPPAPAAVGATTRAGAARSGRARGGGRPAPPRDARPP